MYYHNLIIYEETNYINGVSVPGGLWNDQPVYSDELEYLCPDFYTNLGVLNPQTTCEDANSYIDPNDFLYNYPKYNSMTFNGVIKWNYIKGSNIYIVLTSKKIINGKPFRRSSDLGDFLSFNNKEVGVEVLRDYTIMIKIDYWFEK